MSAITSTFLRLIHQEAGGVIQWLAAAIVGELVTCLSAWGCDVPPDAVMALRIKVIGGLTFLLTTAIQVYQAKQAAKVQAALGVKPDSWIGDVTVAAAREQGIMG